VIKSNTGKITEANPFISELLGYPPDELLGKERGV
jgi:PAS domain-containing protein